MSTIVTNTRNTNLKFLDNLEDYQVHRNDVDIRGFKVNLLSGEHIGEVEGLLADTSVNLVRYAEIEIDDDVINRHTRGLYNADDQHALIPIGIVEVDADNRKVYINDLLFDQAVDYPRYNRNSGYTTSYEIDTNNYLSDFHPYGSTYDRNRFDNVTYRNANALDNTFYGSRFYAPRNL